MLPSGAWPVTASAMPPSMASSSSRARVASRRARRSRERSRLSATASPPPMATERTPTRCCSEPKFSGEAEGQRQDEGVERHDRRAPGPRVDRREQRAGHRQLHEHGVLTEQDVQDGERRHYPPEPVRRCPARRAGTTSCFASPSGFELTSATMPAWRFGTRIPAGSRASAPTTPRRSRWTGRTRTSWRLGGRPGAGRRRPPRRRDGRRRGARRGRADPFPSRPLRGSGRARRPGDAAGRRGGGGPVHRARHARPLGGQRLPADRAGLLHRRHRARLGQRLHRARRGLARGVPATRSSACATSTSRCCARATARTSGTRARSSTSTWRTGSTASAGCSPRWTRGALAGELLDAAWSDAPDHLRPAAALSLAAHLEKLADEGRLPAGVEVRASGGQGL